MTYTSAGRSNRTIYLTIIVAVLTLGCSSYQDLAYTTRGYTLRLPREAPVFVAIPKDASMVYSSGKPANASSTYPESGQITARVIAQAFEKHASKVQMASETQALTGALKQARADGFKFLVWPTLIQWTERSGHRRDQIVVKLVIFDTDTRKTLDLVTLKGRSVKRAGAYPKELLSEPVNDYVDSLYLGP